MVSDVWQSIKDSMDCWLLPSKGAHISSLQSSWLNDATQAAGVTGRHGAASVGHASRQACLGRGGTPQLLRSCLAHQNQGNFSCAAQQPDEASACLLLDQCICCVCCCTWSYAISDEGLMLLVVPCRSWRC